MTPQSLSEARAVSHAVGESIVLTLIDLPAVQELSPLETLDVLNQYFPDDYRRLYGNGNA